jgi:Flp pilus assembly CpaF family ATPase
MLQSQILNLAKEVARGSLIDYTKKEIFTPEQAEFLKDCIIANVEICLSGFVQENDLIP